MRTYFILVCACLISLAAQAQPPKTYAETKREQDWKKYQDDFIEGTRYNRNTPSRSNSNTDNSAAQALADQWRRNSGRRTAAEQKEWEKNAAAQQEQRKREEAARLEKEKKLAAAIADFNASRATKESTRKPALDKNITSYAALGFNVQEADRFAWVITDFPDGSKAYVSDEERNAALKAVAAAQKYKAIKNTATYDELARLIPDMHAASLTAMQAWQDLGRRFTEKKSETERWEFYAMPAIFERHPNEHPAVEDFQEQATERFFELFARHPAAAIEAVSAFAVDYYHPLYRSGMYNKMNTDEGRRWAEVMLLSTNNYNSGNRRDQWRKEMFESDWSVAYWKKKTNADWMALSEMADIAPIFVFERLAYTSRNRLVLGSGKKGAPQTNNYFGAPYQFLWDEIADLATAGEASCMNAYGFYLASNKKSSAKERRRGIQLLRHAVDTGVIWAPLNLLFLAEAAVQDTDPVDSAEAAAKRFMATVSPFQSYMVANELKGLVERRYIDARHAKFAYSLARQAANAGHEKGLNLFTRPDWLDIGVRPGILLEKDWGKKYAGLVVPGQHTLFTSWPSAVEALPHFKSFIRDSMENKDVVTFQHKDAFVVFPRTTNVGGYTAGLNLASTKLTAYTLKMNFSMIQNPLPDGFFGLSWRGPSQSNPAIYFMINPAKRQYFFGSLGYNSQFKIYHTSRSDGKGFSNAINTWDTQYYSSNEIGVERNGNQVKLSINGTVVETIDISPYPNVFENMSNVGYGYGEGKFSAWIRDFFVSVKE